MTKKLKNGKLVDMDASEQAEYDARQADFAASAPQRKAAAVRERRTAMAYGGFTFNGTFIRTDTETRGVLDALRAKAKENSQLVVDFDAEQGYVTMNAAQVIAIADAAFAYVQRCFSVAKTVIDNIGQYETPEAAVAAFEEAMLD